MSTSYAELAEMLKDGGMAGGIYGGDDETHEMFESSYSGSDPVIKGFLSDITLGGDIDIFGGVNSFRNTEDSNEEEESPFITTGIEEENIIENPIFDDIMEPTDPNDESDTHQDESDNQYDSDESAKATKETKAKETKAKATKETHEDVSEFVTISPSNIGSVSDITKGINNAVANIYF
jgi:hypothetical protein